MRKVGNDADPYSVAMINSSMTVVGHESTAEVGTLHPLNLLILNVQM